MKKIIKKYYIAFFCIVVLSYSAACSKRDEFLDKSPLSSLVIPSSFRDFQAILDFSNTMNLPPSLGEESADDYYTIPAFLQTQPIKDQTAYLWASDIFQGIGNQSEYNTSYSAIFNANVVSEGLDKMTVVSSDQTTWNTLKGSCHFFRGFAFYNIAQVFAPVYDSATANTDLGISLRLSSDLNIPSTRSSITQTYTQILSDLNAAVRLLPTNVPIGNLNRPSKPAAYAMLARVYLGMRNYKMAGLYADSCLQMYNTLLTYSSLPMSTSHYQPFPLANPESIFVSQMSNNPFAYLVNVTSTQISIDTILFKSYSTNDLRRSIYFYQNGTAINLNAGYAGPFYSIFTGLAVDEMYLMRAECFARAGNTASALADLNTLLPTRYKPNTFTQVTATSAAEALNKILVERRKELVMRGLRWTDLRRLNKEGANIILTRVYNGQTYTLAPNDPKYVLPFPPDVIALSGMPQNQR